VPPGTIGFDASGKLTREDYRNVLEPALRAFEFFAWLTPGEVKVFGLDQIDAAKSWVAA